MERSYTSIDIILADDHQLFCDGFSFMIKQHPEFNLVAVARNGVELIQQARRFQPNVIVSDIFMPQMNGIQATRYITKEFPNIGIIALSMCDEDNLISEMIDAGAKGYLLKQADQKEIIEGIKAVYHGQTYYCRNTYIKLNEIRVRKNCEPHFSEREIIIIRLICASRCSQEIGKYLGLSRRTVEAYRERIMQKMDVKKTVDLVIYALKNKIYQFDQNGHEKLTYSVRI